MQATPPGVRSPLGSPLSSRLRPDLGVGGRRVVSERGQMSGEGDYNFRRVAIRRKSNLSYLPLGTPRPWSRPSSHLGWAETATFRGQAPADSPASPAVYGISQAKGQIKAAAASQHHSHGNG